jgi:hypothetical protein
MYRYHNDANDPLRYLLNDEAKYSFKCHFAQTPQGRVTLLDDGSGSSVGALSVTNDVKTC